MENWTSYTSIALRQRQRKGWACYPHQNNFTKIKNTQTELLWLGSALLYAELVFFTNIYYVSLVMIFSIQNNARLQNEQSDCWFSIGKPTNEFQ